MDSAKSEPEVGGRLILLRISLLIDSSGKCDALNMEHRKSLKRPCAARIAKGVSSVVMLQILLGSFVTFVPLFSVPVYMRPKPVSPLAVETEECLLCLESIMLKGQCESRGISECRTEEPLYIQKCRGDGVQNDNAESLQRARQTQEAGMVV